MQVPVMQVPSAVPLQIPAPAPMQVPAAVPTLVTTVPPAMTVPGTSAIVTQPQSQPQSQVILNVQTSNTVMGMPMGDCGGPMAFGPITWSTGLFQCFEDLPICLLGAACPFVLPCYLSSLFGEICCLGLLPGAMFALRTAVRERYKIPGDLLNDYCAICCCVVCALCQMAREMKGREWQHCRLPLPQPNLHFHFRRQRRRR